MVVQLGNAKVWSGTEFVDAVGGSAATVVATGGTVTTANILGSDYNIHTFTGNGTLTVTTGGLIEYVIVAGGGGGGGGTSATPGRGSNGVNTVFGSIGTAVGGGGGGAYASGGGLPGGSGGGGSYDSNSPGSGTAGQGFAGGFGTDAIQRQGGGGGGASEKGQFPRLEGATYIGGDGGDGLRTLVSGSYAYLAGGGAGVTRSSVPTSTASGGLGGGANAQQGVNGQNGIANTGGGGGACSKDSIGNGGGGAGGLLSGFTTIAAGSYAVTIGSGGDGGGGGGATGGSGGSGIVIVRYLI